MSTDPLIELANEIDAITVTCDMQHPADNGIAEPCTRPALFLATVHDCRKKRDYPHNGSTVPICDEYLAYLKNLDYPRRCPGCNLDITSLIQLLWEIRRLKI